jgi:23S rRNA (pseudouridine1915-N3)-methyltransferase
MAFSISILCIGKVSPVYSSVYDHYQKLIRPFSPIEFQWLKSPGGSYADPNQLIEREGDLLCKRIPSGSYPVALTPEGTSYESLSFSRWIGKHREAGHPLIFIVGGAYGLSNRAKKMAKETLSLSSLTLCHTLTIGVLMEQVYRALTILARYPYHK